MSEQQLTPTPEVVQVDTSSFSEPWIFSDSLVSQSSDPEPPNAVNNNLDLLLRVYMDYTFELCRPYLSLPSDEEKDQLKAQIFCGSLFNTIDSATTTPECPCITDSSAPGPNKMTGIWNSESATSLELGPIMPLIDPSTYFDFDGVYTDVKSSCGEETKNEEWERFSAQFHLPGSLTESIPAPLPFGLEAGPSTDQREVAFKDAE